MKYFIVVGEASGDLHGSNLMREIKRVDSSADFLFFGGEKMEREGGRLIKHYADMAFMGLVKVLMNLRSIKKNFALAHREIEQYAPDVVILIDYPGFNLRVAKFTHNLGIKTYYYISPKIWAWKESRVEKIKLYVDKVFTIFPFETEFYKKHNYDVTYVGNPTVDQILTNKSLTFDKESITSKYNLSDSKEIITLLPGSRKGEISRVLPVMLEATLRFPDYQFIIAGAPSIDLDYYNGIIDIVSNRCGTVIGTPIIYDDTLQLVKNSRASIVTSGTATLEAGIIGTPQIVCYKMELGRFASFMRPFILKLEFFSLVNIIVGREVVKELFQHNCTKDTLSKELSMLLEDREYKERLLDGYDELHRLLEGTGGSQRAASAIVTSLRADLEKE